MGDVTNPLFGPSGPIITAAATVIAEGRPLATVGSLVAPHGNPYNPNAPGFNPPCATATVIVGVPNIMVEGRPLAPLQSPCSCGLHFIQSVGATTVLVGG
jgi:uncharacterized Zn-binding protein involved in type VI secretion